MRQRRLPAKLHDYEIATDNAVSEEGELIQFSILIDSEPISYKEAMKEQGWHDAMMEELRSIEKNNTRKLVNLPSNKKAIDVKWVFKVKLSPKGKIVKHKARLFAKGFLQRPGVDYFEVFAPVARTRLVVALACGGGWSLFHLNVKPAFLNGPLEEEVYVSQPLDFALKGKEHMVYKLDKALYGLK
ncbi:hypothetical protein Fmac_029764 [Flemingia macrophylla]|uniref:Reverse transcriptase Ty1/copia-type domain-containing protein n=1 Tax=Flemingia macrophylla TaxID=520843 RepID=A0ABD1LCX1_9FABA